MRRILIALTLLVGMFSFAEAMPWQGAVTLGDATLADSLITPVACDRDEFYCRRGLQRMCRGGRCDCVPCAMRYDRPRYHSAPRDYDDRPRQRPRRQVCPPRYTVQDGVCKPYRGY